MLTITRQPASRKTKKTCSFIHSYRRNTQKLRPIILIIILFNLLHPRVFHEQEDTVFSQSRTKATIEQVQTIMSELR